jgi:hypothetical protein
MCGGPGVNWQNNTGAGPDAGLQDYVLSPAPFPHQSVRTPLALVEHEDREGYFTFFFTAFENQHAEGYQKQGLHPPNVPHEQYEAMYASEMQLVATNTEAM